MRELNDTTTSLEMSWLEAAQVAVRFPLAPVGCPACRRQSVTAAWHVLDLASREATVDLSCSACAARHSVRTTLPRDVPNCFPFERFPLALAAIKEQVEAMTERARKHGAAMPAAAFTTHPLWLEAKWNATTFRWHPTSEFPPTMGLVFDNAEAGLEIFREAKRQMNQEDRFEEIRLSIIEGYVPGQERRPGYSIHICPDPEALATHATSDDFVLDPTVVPFMGQWNRHYPIPGMPKMLPTFKREFEKHGQFMIAPVVKKADGQQWFEPTLGIIKHDILFRDLCEITSEDDPDAAAHVLPQLITPPSRSF
jgi:hypothetical protein